MAISMTQPVDHVKRLQSGPYKGWTILVREFDDVELSDVGLFRDRILVLPPVSETNRHPRWEDESSFYSSFPRPILDLVRAYRAGGGYADLNLLEFLIKALQDN